MLSGDIEVQAGFSLSQQIGIVMTCLIEDERMNLVELVQAVRACFTSILKEADDF